VCDRENKEDGGDTFVDFQDRVDRNVFLCFRMSAAVLVSERRWRRDVSRVNSRFAVLIFVMMLGMVPDDEIRGEGEGGEQGVIWRVRMLMLKAKQSLM
jgi:hypothetical protein